MRISRKTIVALALSAPLVCAAAEPTLLVGGPGNQTAPSMSPPYLAYVDDAAGAPDLFLKDLGTGALTRVTGDGLAVGGPDVAGGFLAYRRDGWVEVFNVRTGLALPSIAAPGSGRVSVSPTLVAWEQGGPGSGDVGWKRLASVSAAVLQAPPGDQHAVATAFGWVAWIDGAAGAVLLADSTPGAGDPQAIFTVAEAGGAMLDLAAWAADSASAPTFAVLVDGAAGAEIVVFDAAGAERNRLAIPGGKLHPHLRGDWVGFEDLSTGISQVVLWDWVHGRLFVPAPNGAPQVLHDLVAADANLQVVWAEDRGAGFDIYLYEAAPPPVDPPRGPVRCTDADAVVLADFTVVGNPSEVEHPDGRHHDRKDRGLAAPRDDDRGNDDRGNDGWHVSETGAHDERWHAFRWTRGAGGALFAAPAPTPVLVCIDATDVASGWVGVGSRVVASPSDFHAGAVSLEARLTVAAGDGRAGAVIAGKRGCSLRVRVLADPGGDANGASDGWTCGTSGGAGALAALFLAAAALRRPLRRSRRG